MVSVTQWKQIKLPILLLSKVSSDCFSPVVTGRGSRGGGSHATKDLMNPFHHYFVLTKSKKSYVDIY